MTISVQKSPGQRLQWEDVRYFLALARDGSLSRAARRLQVEHSTVARRVEALELALGLRLFDRLPRGWQLSTEGETLAGLAEKMEEEAFSFERAAAGAGAVRGTVRVSIAPTLANLFLVPRIAAMRERWPGIALEVAGEVRDVNLSRREADVAIRIRRPRERGLVVRSLGKIGYGLYAEAGYALRDEAKWEFVGFDESLRHVLHQRWLEQLAGTRPFALRANDQMALHAAARTGLGIACLPHYQVSQDPLLAPVPSPTPAPPMEVWLVLHADVRRSPRVRTVADLVTEIFVGAADFLAG
jgi:DNA-binding transcriptional LysR family regulator